MKPHQLSVLRILCVNGLIGTNELAAQVRMLPELADLTDADVKHILERLEAAGMCTGQRIPSKQTLWESSGKAKRFIQSLSVVKGEFPAPREAASTEPWKPPKWIPVRAGAEDHLRHPSRRGTDEVAHSPPLSIAGRDS